MPKTRRKSEENRLFQKTRIQTILDKSPWDSTAIFIFFCYFSVPSLNSAAFSKFSCSSPSPHPIQSWNSEKNSGYTRPTLFVGWGEGLDLCELENAQKYKSVPKLLSMNVGLTLGSVRFSLYLLLVICVYIERTWKPAYICSASSYPDDSDANVCQACGKPKSREPTQGARSNADRSLVNL